MKSQPVAVNEGLAAIASYSLVILRDMEDDDLDSSLRHPKSPGKDGLSVGTDWVVFRSAYAWHDVAVRTELWESEPSEEAVGSRGAWARSWQTSMDVTAPGTFRVWELAVGPTEEWAFWLPAAGAYAVRAYSTGADPELDENQDEVPPGTERFLIQFWRQ